MLTAQRALGYFGLIPFVGLSAASVFDLSLMGDATAALRLYAFGIISFLLGAWWRATMVSALRLILSNAFFVISFLYYLIGGHYFLPFAAAMLYTIYLIEQHTKLFPAFDRSYTLLRCLLTNVAAASLFAAFLLG